MLSSVNPPTALLRLVSMMAPLEVETFSEPAGLPPTLPPEKLTAVESVIEALFEPDVEALSEAKVLPAFVSVMPPLDVETLSALARIAPDWLTAPPPASVSVPPTWAPATSNPVESVIEALSLPVVATVSEANWLPELVSVMAPDVVDTSRALATMAPVCVRAPPVVNLSAPPTFALVTLSAVESVSVALSLPDVATLSDVN